MQKVNTFLLNTYFKAKFAIEDYLKEEKGEANLIAVILILAIVIALVVIFKNQITEIVRTTWAKINTRAQEAYGDVNI